MTLRVQLLGHPSAELDGTVLPGPPGRKTWALLALLVLAERPMSRRAVATLLFPDANDPLGALRWTLSQLRRGMAGNLQADGDPVVLRLHANCRVDVADLVNGHLDAGDPGSQEPLLMGGEGVAGPDFDLWLTAARHRISTAQGVRLRDAADRAIADAEPSIAVVAAARAVLVEPYQPAARAALVSSLVAAGDHASALAQLREWSALIRREQRVGELLHATRRRVPDR